jgi:DNA-3-methyladenine glycosylase
MAERRQRPRREWTNGPAKLAQALSIDGTLNGACLFAKDSVIWVEEDNGVADLEVARGPRIGLGKTPEPWHSIPWRYWLAGNHFVSR